jgi:hypothetical protein
MANVVSNTRFLYIDAVSGGLTNERFNIIGLYWISIASASDIAAADTFTCTDTAGKVIFTKKAVAAGDGLEVTFGYPGVPTVGFIVTALDGGICTVIADRVVQV